MPPVLVEIIKYRQYIVMKLFMSKSTFYKHKYYIIVDWGSRVLEAHRVLEVFKHFGVMFTSTRCLARERLPCLFALLLSSMLKLCICIECLYHCA